MREMPPSQVTDSELPPDLDPAVLAELQRVFDEVTPEQFEAETGLGIPELSQWVTYEDGEGATHAATVAVMLTHTKCPVGKWVRNAYVKEGLRGVEELFTDLHKREPGLALQISEPTRERAAKKKEPEPPLTEEPEFARVETALVKTDHASTSLNIHQRVLHEEIAARNHETRPHHAVPAAIHESSDEPLQNEALSESPDSPKAKTTLDVELDADDIDTDEAMPTQVVQACSGQIIPKPAIIAPQVISSELAAPQIEPPEVVDLRSEIVAEFVAPTTLGFEEAAALDEPLPDQLSAGEPTLRPVEKLVGSGVVEAIVRVEALTPEQVEKTEQLVTSLPSIVYDQLVGYMQSADPEAVAAAETLVVSIAIAADRLHDLSMLDVLDGPEAEQIEAFIREWYKELLTKADITFDEETIDQLIELIKSADYGQDEGTHEHKLPDFALPDGVTSSALREQEIGRLAVQQLTTPA